MRQIYAYSSASLFGILILVGCVQSNEVTTEAGSGGPDTTAQSVSFVNTICPIMGGEPKATLSAEFDSRTIGFCCDGCPQKWAALSDEQKSAKLAKATGNTESHEDHQDDHYGRSSR